MARRNRQAKGQTGASNMELTEYWRPTVSPSPSPSKKTAEFLEGSCSFDAKFSTDGKRLFVIDQNAEDSKHRDGDGRRPTMERVRFIASPSVSKRLLAG